MGIFRRRSSAVPAPAPDPAAALADCLRAIAAHEAPEDALQPASGAHHLPPLVEPGAVLRSVACVPLCAGETPLGSLVLLALAPRALSEHDLHQLARPLDEVVRMIESARRPRAGAPAPTPEPSGVLAEPGLGGEVAADPERASLAAKLAARSEETDRLR